MCLFGLILEYFYQVSIKLLEHQSCIQNSRERTLQWTCFSCRHSSPLLRWQLMGIEQWDRSPEVSLHAREQPQTTRGFKQESGISDTSECFQTLSLMGRNSRHLIIVTTQTTPQKIKISYRSVYRSIILSIVLSFVLSYVLSTFLSMFYLKIYLSFCLSVCLSVSLSLLLFYCPVNCHPSIRPSVLFIVAFSMVFHISIYLSSFLLF